MRLAIAFAALITFAGIGSTANASCEKCPNGYSFWHSKDACLADDGSGATAQPLYWKEDRARANSALYGSKLGGRKNGDAGPAGG
jgi:hypothetical protein